MDNSSSRQVIAEVYEACETELVDAYFAFLEEADQYVKRLESPKVGLVDSGNASTQDNTTVGEVSDVGNGARDTIRVSTGGTSHNVVSSQVLGGREDGATRRSVVSKSELSSQMTGV